MLAGAAAFVEVPRHTSSGMFVPTLLNLVAGPPDSSELQVISMLSCRQVFVVTSERVRAGHRIAEASVSGGHLEGVKAADFPGTSAI